MWKAAEVRWSGLNSNASCSVTEYLQLKQTWISSLSPEKGENNS